MRLIDISVDIPSKMEMPATYGDSEVVVVLTPDMPDSHGRTTRKMMGILHTGTHIDGPEHLIPGGKQISDFPLEQFYGEAVVADVRHRGPGEEITVEDLDKAVAGKLKPGDMLLIRTGRTGWSRRTDKDSYYAGSPYLAKDVGSWCVEKGVKLLGADCRPNKKGDTSYNSEKELLQNGILYLKNIDNLDEIRQDRVTLVAFPIKFIGTEAAMTRAVVIEG